MTESKQSKQSTSSSSSSSQLQQSFDAEREQGYAGKKVDPTPNSAYTLQGVIKGEATPETDDKQAEKARANRGFAGSSPKVVG